LSLSGNLSVDAPGITQSGGIKVTGTSALKAASEDIVLADKANNIFGGAVTANGKDVTLATGEQLTVGGTTTGKLDLDVGKATVFQSATVGGDLKLASGG